VKFSTWREASQRHANLVCQRGEDHAEEQQVDISAEASFTSEAPKIDTGDTAWMIVATAFVMLMTLPGLALFYGGLAKRKDSLNTMAMSFVTYCFVSFLWVLYGFTFAFGTDIGGIIGSAEKLFLSGVGPNSINDLAKTIPEYVYVVYQLTFAAMHGCSSQSCG
jgi:hypothetical protein